jgi:diamine N-acetyltransferase
MICGKRTRLRALERSDLPRFVEWLNDHEVTAGLQVYAPLSMQEEESWFENMLKRPAEEHTLAIEIRQGDSEWLMIGSCGFHAFNWRVRSAEFGIFIGDKSKWNQGYGTETVRLLLRYGFDTLNLNRIALEVYENNPGAIRAYEKAGFVHEGRKRQGMFKGGEYVDVLLMSVVHSEWQEATNL